MQMFDRNTPISIRITLISSETVTEAQWKTALSESAFVNVTCSASTFASSLTEPSKVVGMFDSETNRFKVSGDS